MQRRRKKGARLANAEEKKFQAYLKEQLCCVTGDYGVDVHHCKGSTYKHDKVLVGHYFCLPLSPDSHRMYHMEKHHFIADYGKQGELWAVLADRYTDETGKEIPENVRNAIIDCNE